MKRHRRGTWAAASTTDDGAPDTSRGSGTTKPGAIIDTADVAPRERFDYWRSSLLAAPLPAESTTSDARSFSCRVGQVEAGPLRLARVAGSDHSVIRTRGHIAEGSDGCCMVLVVDAGATTVTQAGGTAIAYPDDVLILDMDEPGGIVHRTRCAATFLMMPGEPFRGRSSRSGPMVLTAGTSPVAALVANYIRGLPADDDSLSGIGDLAEDQATALIRRGLGQREAAPRPARLVDLVHRIIAAEIANPDLSAKLLCGRLGVSRTSLFDALATERITLGAAIRDRRFAGCRSDLRRAATTGMTLSEIAERWGYRDLASFSRAFKKRFGVAPTRWRDSA